MHRKTLCSLIVLFIGFLQHVNSSVIPTSMNSSLSATRTFIGSISSNAPTFTRPDTYSNSYYYQIIEVTVYTSGTYSFTSDSSSTSLVGCLYQTYFDPSHPSSGGSLYFGCNDGSAMGGKFSILNQYLSSGTRYLLVVTTSQAYSTTSYYTVTSSGLGSTYASMTTYTSQSITRTGSLWTSNPEFNRPGSSSYSSSYYYDTYDVTISSSGTYSFKSNNVYSFDPYACLYQTSFNPSIPSLNKLACDDDSAGNLQFLIRQNLDSYTRYILVVTTSSSYITGSYSFTVTGPSYPTLSLTTTTSQIIILIGPIVGGVIGFVVFVIILIVLIRVCQFRRTRPIIRQTIIQPQYNPTPSVAIYPIVHQTPYGNPPPYNAYMTNK